MSHAEHERQARGVVARFAVLTISDTRTLATDRSGDAIASLVAASGHVVARREIARDEPADIAAMLDTLLDDAGVTAIVTTGGTGVAPRDRTIDLVAGRLDVELPGFGELFRSLSFEQIGAAAMLSRAVGGIARGKPLFALPGSPAAVELAMSRLILPQIRHLLTLLAR